MSDKVCVQCGMLIPEGDTFVLDWNKEQGRLDTFCVACGPRPATVADLQEAWNHRVAAEFRERHPDLDQALMRRMFDIAPAMNLDDFDGDINKYLEALLTLARQMGD